MERALKDAKDKGHRLVVLVGDEPYYKRVGFKRVPSGHDEADGPGRSRAHPGRRSWSKARSQGVSGVVRPDWDTQKEVQ